MQSTKDIKFLLLAGYIAFYFLAVGPPIFIDSRLTSHVLFGPRSYYPYAFFCIAIFVVFFGTQALIMSRSDTIPSLYATTVIFFVAIIASLPIFLPEFPHGNLVFVGVMATFLFSFSIFVWSIGRQISGYTLSLEPKGKGVTDYLNSLSTFVRQGAFAAVTLFGVLFYGAFTNMFVYVDSIVKSDPDRFLVKFNAAMQVSFYAIFSIAGAVRYLFLMNLHVLSEYKKLVQDVKKTESKSRKTKAS